MKCHVIIYATVLTVGGTVLQVRTFKIYISDDSLNIETTPTSYDLKVV